MKKIKLYIAMALYFTILNTNSFAENSVIESTDLTTNSWKPLKKRASYPNSAYTLREDIAYFELRKYIFDNQGEKMLSDKYAPYFSIYRKNLSSYSPKVVSQFRRIPFNNSQPTDIKVEQNYYNYKFKAKGFIIRTDNHFWTINEQKDFIWLFDRIDTEAELHYFMTINDLFNYPYTLETSYQKTTQGYDVKQKHIQHKVTMKHKGRYDEYTSYDEHTTYLYHIHLNGIINKEKISTIRKDEQKSKVQSDFHGDPEIKRYIEPVTARLSTVLKNEKFIAPQ